MPGKKPKNVRAKTVTSFGIFILEGKWLLIGFDKNGKIAFVGGKEADIDNAMPFLILLNEAGQEVGKSFSFRLIFPRPLVFCTNPEGEHEVMENPKPGSEVDLRFVYLMEALNSNVMENQPEEFKSPQFVEPSFFRGKQAGTDIRQSVAYALKIFGIYDGSFAYMPDFRPEEDDPAFTSACMEYDLLQLGLGTRFARKYSRQPRLQT